MKKRMFAILSLALLGIANKTYAQSNITLYGVLDTSITYIHGNDGASNNTWAMGNGNLTGSSWGLKGEDDIGGDSKAIFQLENGFNSSNGVSVPNEQLYGYQAFAGLHNDAYGTLTLGRQYDPLIDLIQPLTADNYFGALFATPGDVDNNDNSLRVSNAIKYASPVYNGFQLAALYGFGSIAGTLNAGQTWAVALAYSKGPVSVAAGYFHASNQAPEGALRTGWNSSSDGTFDGPEETFFLNNAYVTAKSISIAHTAAKYVMGLFTFGLGYSNAQYKSDGFSAFNTTEKYNTGRSFVVYQAMPTLLIGLGYIYTKATGNASATYHQISAGANYMLSKRTDLYLAGAYQHASGTQPDGASGIQNAQASVGSYGYGGTNKQLIVALGLRHTF